MKRKAIMLHMRSRFSTFLISNTRDSFSSSCYEFTMCATIAYTFLSVANVSIPSSEAVNKRVSSTDITLIVNGVYTSLHAFCSWFSSNNTLNRIRNITSRILMTYVLIFRYVLLSTSHWKMHDIRSKVKNHLLCS